MTDIGPWTLNGDKIGAAIIISLTQPASYPMSEWPVKLSKDSALGYDEQYLPASATNVSRIFVLVDQRRDRVVTFLPDVGAHVSPKPGAESRFPRASD